MLYSLGSTFEKRLHLGYTCVGNTNEKTRSELLDGLIDGGLNLLCIANVYNSKCHVRERDMSGNVSRHTCKNANRFSSV